MTEPRPYLTGPYGVPVPPPPPLADGGCLSPLFDKSPPRQGRHDVVAKTMVIRTR